MNLRQEPIRSAAYLRAARGQPCQLRFVGVCLDPYGLGNETTVFAHYRHGKGMGQKAHDFDGADACANCHRFLDEGWVGKTEWTVVLATMLRGLERTLESRFRAGVLSMPMDAEKPASERPAKPRKPKADRAKINNKSAWPAGRKLQSGPFPKRIPK